MFDVIIGSSFKLVSLCKKTKYMLMTFEILVELTGIMLFRLV